jgi:hypothetical protein
MEILLIVVVVLLFLRWWRLGILSLAPLNCPITERRHDAAE